jgi:hypothetical protein
MRHPSFRFAVAIATLLTTAACGEQVAAPTSHHTMHGSDAVLGAADVSPGLVAQVHAATARFHSTTQATKAGYSIGSPCVAHPTLGAMGFHWLNTALVDPVFDPLQPEVLVYSPDKNGKPKLAAVEYIVIDVGQPAPTFDGHPFDVGGTPVPVPHWSLHVWTHETNPAGILSPWNPAVSCS